MDLKHYQVFSAPPADFSSSMEAAGCYCTFQEELLLVKRQTFKTQGGKWGVPAGKLEKGEDPIHAIIRELKEEVGITLENDHLQAMGTLFVRLPPIDYTYHMFFTRFHHRPEILLDLTENQEFGWFLLNNAFQLTLMAAGKESLLHYKNYLNRTKPLRRLPPTYRL